MINGPSRAKAYFDEIRLPGNGANFLNKLVGSPTTFESEFLEFKGANNPNFAKDLSEKWAKCLSCFANSDGGVLIFGIDAPKGAAKSLSLVQDIAGLCEKLKNTLSKFTEPPVLGVEIVPYADPDGSNKGFVVCYIPSSPWRPHQVRSDGQPGQFFVRASDNCVPCNHATLRALFAPQYIAVMEIHYRKDKKFIDGSTNVVLQCVLENKGPATARELFVLCRSAQISGDPNYSHALWEETRTGRGRGFLCKRSIHPEERLDFCNLPLGREVNGVEQFKHESYTCQFSIYAHNQTPTELELTLRPTDPDATSFKQAAHVEKR